MLELLNELHRAGIGIEISSPKLSWRSDKWKIRATKEVDETRIDISVEDDELADAIQSIYDKWIVVTKHLPTHDLKQIEYKQES